MTFSGKDNHVWPSLSLCSLTNGLSLRKHEKWFCPNFNNIAKTKLVLHCNGPFCVRLLRHALPISLLILRKKPTVLQSITAPISGKNQLKSLDVGFIQLEF